MTRKKKDTTQTRPREGKAGPLIPNAETIAAIEETRRGGLRSHRSVKELMADLNADDGDEDSTE